MKECSFCSLWCRSISNKLYWAPAFYAGGPFFYFTKLAEKAYFEYMTILMNKKIGETPLECLNRLRVEQPEYEKIPLTYVGRLDPMADGLLLVLAGDECKKREDFLGLDKEYVCEILWGFETDTYDILGKVTDSHNVVEKDSEKFSKTLQKFVGKSQQKFPPYSSKPVQGKPLHEWARAGRLNEIEIPSKEIEVKFIDFLGAKSASSVEMQKIILERIDLVKGDFRQVEIIEKWQGCFGGKTDANFVVSKIRVSCSTGTYIRGLVQEMGKMLGFGAIVLSLTRTKIGDFKII